MVDAGRVLRGAVRPHARLDRGGAGAAVDRARPPRLAGDAAVDPQRLPAGDRRARRQRRAARRHVRAARRLRRSASRSSAPGRSSPAPPGARTTVIAGRIIQGVGAAATLPLSLALVADAFPPRRRAAAVGIWTAISSLALAIGPLIGGVLVDADWRLIFWINVPFARSACSWSSSPSVRPRRRDGEPPPRHRAASSFSPRRWWRSSLPLVESQPWGLELGARRSGCWWRASSPCSCLLRGRAPGGAADRRVRPVPQRALLRRLGGGVRARRLLLGADAPPAPVPRRTSSTTAAVESGLLVLPITVPMIMISPVASRLIARTSECAC